MPSFPLIFSETSNAGHFSQIVWATTRYVGCGSRQLEFNGTYYTKYTCLYGPAGKKI